MPSTRSIRFSLWLATPIRRVGTGVPALFLSVGLMASYAHAQLSGELGAHDPSTLVKEGSTYYYFATGQGIAARSSNDRSNWIGRPSVFGTQPAWTSTAVPSYTGFAWAPDIAYFNGKYHLYYSISSWGTIDSAIGVATTTTLANAAWTDRGKVVQSDAVWEAGPNTDTTGYNAIDPSILVDSSTNKVWMSWGSYSSGIVVSEIDPSTGKRLGGSIGTMVANNAAGGGWGSSIEASALVKKGSYYYLFVNYGGCCAGVDSTYDIRVGRSTSPTGPFLDKNGIDMRNGGGSMFLDDDGRMTGPGHFSYYTENGQDQFGYHFYNGDANGAPTYNLHNLYWTADAWPSYAAVAPDWRGATNSGWSTAANWSGSVVPNGVGHLANFDSNSAGRYTVSLDGVGRTLGSMNFRSTASYSVGAAAGPTITLDAETGTPATINVAAGNHTIAAPLNVVDDFAVNVSSNSTLTLASAVAAPRLTKYGRGTLRLAGTNAYGGNVTVRWGTVDIAAGSVTAAGWTNVGTIANEFATLNVRGAATYAANADVNIGDTGDTSTAATGVLNLGDTATLTVGSGGGLYVGSGYRANTMAVGTVNQTGGTLTANGNFDGAFIIGGGGSAAAVGSYNLSGGTVHANTNVRVGGYGTGTMTQDGGTFNANSYVAVGRFAGSTGTWQISGGTLNQTNASTSVIIGESGQGTLQVSDAGRVNANGTLRIGLNASGVGVVDLYGGVLSVPAITRGNGSATLGLSGGTLRATRADADLISNLSTARVGVLGGRIDTNGLNVSVSQPLLHDSSLGSTLDGGLIKIGAGRLTLTGANTYTGTTVISDGSLRANASARAILLSGSSGVALESGQLQFDYTGGTSPVTQVKSILTAGYANGFKTGQIRGTALPAGRTLGYGDNGSGIVTVRVTLPGDAEFDGDVDFNDFLVLQNNFGKTGSRFDQANFNYDNVTDFNDFLALQNYFGQSVNGDAVAYSDGQVAALTAFATSVFNQAIPEPGNLAALALVGVAGVRRVRRR